MPPQRRHALAGRRIPDLDCLVVRAGREPGRVRLGRQHSQDVGSDDRPVRVDAKGPWLSRPVSGLVASVEFRVIERERSRSPLHDRFR